MSNYPIPGLRLRETIVKATNGRNLTDWTVQDASTDPYRQFTPTRHRNAEWLADTTAALRLVGPRHLRGLHYILIDVIKPNGEPYRNNKDDWAWLGENCLKPARWLGYIPWGDIIDHRHAEPTARLWTPPQPQIVVGNAAITPTADSLAPIVFAEDFYGTQPYHLVFVAEKASAGQVLEPLADKYQADLYLLTGDSSDTRIFDIARYGAEDGRPMIVFYFSDSDPSGYNMPIVAGRKLQALKTTQFPELEFQVFATALTPAQVIEYDLPSSVIKDTDSRAEGWFDAFGVEQTEIDALAALQPEVLTQIAEDAVAPFFDATLARRVDEARARWTVRAQRALDDHLGADAPRRREEAAAEVAEIIEAFEVDEDDVDLPELPEIPEAEVDSDKPFPLINSTVAWRSQTRRLIKAKDYDL